MASFRKLAGVLLLGLAFAVFAAGGAASAADRVLTEDSVTRFLSSFAGMRDIAVSEGLRTGMDSETAKDPLSAVLRAIKSSKLKTEAEKIAVAHGFANLRDWAATGRAVAQAYAYVTAGPALGIARATLEHNKDIAISELDKLGLLTSKNKQKLKDALDDASDALGAEPPPENTAIVKKMKPDIDATVNFGLN